MSSHKSLKWFLKLILNNRLIVNSFFYKKIKRKVEKLPKYRKK